MFFPSITSQTCRDPNETCRDVYLRSNAKRACNKIKPIILPITQSPPYQYSSGSRLQAAMWHSRLDRNSCSSWPALKNSLFHLLSLSLQARLNQSKLIQTSHSKFSSSYPTWSILTSTLVINGPGAHPASHTMGTGSFPGVRRLGRGVDHPNPSSAEVKETVELYLYSTSGHSWPVVGWPLPLLTINEGTTTFMSTTKA